jgi:hypothetical protein
MHFTWIVGLEVPQQIAISKHMYRCTHGLNYNVASSLSRMVSDASTDIGLV